MFKQVVCGCFIAVCLLVGARAIMGEETSETTVRPYDGLQAGTDAHAYWEARRVDAINRQIGWNDLFRTRAALASSGTIFYQPYVPGEFGYFDSFAGPYAGGFYDDWPYARGRIFGYGFYDPVPQPIGRKEIQTGPNRWESFPIYAEDVVTSPPPVAAEIPAPAPLPAPKPAAPPIRGREF